MATPKKLIFDIETSPMLLFGWNIGKQEIGYKQIYKERQVLCIGYAFDDGPVEILATNYDTFSLHNRDDESDRDMVAAFTLLAQEADLLIGHNIKRFDIGVLRTRLIKHMLPDLPPYYLVDDTYMQTKGIPFASHKLDYMTKYLGLEQKKEHPYEMWLDVVMKVPGAFENMQEYCKGDVEINRDMYNRLFPYIKSSLNMAVFNENPEACRHCGDAEHMVIRGYRQTATGKHVQYQCMSCGKYSTVGTNILDKSSEYMR